ncbi:MAG: ABC transporter ATP-binding protein/permease [Erysipelotrichaceae bacterium]|nr:ABC transporter ATP-binding protein/permease [Erysipelotrichaceae bacterium]
MLQVKNIYKTYKTGDLVQKALDNVSLNLRDNEFVAILGPSGSGKTTLLNIIGGLDRYDEGDLIINNISTKNYKSRDWDSYRNHTVGFVFQSYNLIPHQTILANVELALTISGVSRKERRQRALKALEETGLKDQAHKKPNQMSGGQMQRVAIARALVNNPDILLADEPTGALDTKTSIQVMELLKKVAKDRLVVMVTHNPELAHEYANRIVNLKDGVITSDSNPYYPAITEVAKYQNMGKSSMSLKTAFGLSINNLLSKKARTILTAFAGSIGIIGIAMILSLSTGFQNYIDKIQEDTMTSYPLTISADSADMFSAMLTMHSNIDKEVEEGYVEEQPFITTVMSSIGTNDLKSFLAYLNDNEDKWQEYVNRISYSYSISPLIYTIDVADNLAQLNPNTLMSSFYSDSASSLLSSVSSAGSMGTFAEADLSSMEENYELIIGHYPTAYNEMVIALSDSDQISDYLLYSLGLRDTTELKTLIADIMGKKETAIANETMKLSYDELLNIDLRLIDPSDLYRYNEKYDVYEDMTSDKEYMMAVYNNSEKIRIVGIVMPDGDGNPTGGVLYLPSLTSHVIDKAKQSELVRKQLANPDVDVFSNNRFDEKKESTGIDFNDMVTIDEEMLKNAFKFNGELEMSDADTRKIVMDSAKLVSDNLGNVTESLNDGLISANKALASSFISAYVGQAVITLPNNCDEWVDMSKPMLGCRIDNLAEDKKNDYVEINGIYVSNSYGYSQLFTNQGAAIFKQYGLDSFIDQALASITDIAIDKALAKTIVSEAFDQYIAATTDMSLIDELPDSGTIVDETVAKYQSIIFEDAYNQAQELTSLLVAQGIGKAVGEVMKPVTDLFSKEDLITVDTDSFAKAFNFSANEEEVSRLMESMVLKSEATYNNNLISLGYQDVDNPSSISIYFKNFDAKEQFLNFLHDYNAGVKEEQVIKYTDITGLLMSSVQTIISSVSYVLIAFVSISLVVSSIMIGIITYISVLERTKEIGILRAIGASKRNISSIFNAETFIVGLLAGLIGVGATYLLNIPVNMFIHSINTDVTAVLELRFAVILVVISVILTLIGGIIPSRAAAQKDPITALRTE